MLQGLTDVSKYFSDQRSMSIAVLPDPSLQFLEWRRLAITDHEPFDIGSDGAPPFVGRVVNPERNCLATALCCYMFCAKGHDDRLELGRFGMGFEIGAQVLPRIGEQHLGHKRHGRRRALDIEQNRAE